MVTFGCSATNHSQQHLALPFHPASDTNGCKTVKLGCQAGNIITVHGQRRCTMEHTLSILTNYIFTSAAGNVGVARTA